jgi:hypothetical protein
MTGHEEFICLTVGAWVILGVTLLVDWWRGPAPQSKADRNPAPGTAA